MARDDEGLTLLHVVARKGNERMTQHLVANGVDIDARNTCSQTPLYQATGHLGSYRTIRLLCESGADMKSKDKNGKTALHNYMDAMSGTDEDRLTLPFLIEQGVEIDAKDNAGYTALHNATCMMRGEKKENRWKPEKIFNRRMERNEIRVAQLISFITVLLENGANPNEQNDYGETALHRAVTDGNESLLRLFLEKKGDVTVKSNDGDGVLAWALKKGNPSDAMIRLLLENGVDMKGQNNKGQTALHCFLIGRYISAVR